MFDEDNINLNLVEQSLKSAMNDNQHNSESLEFFGDSILKFLISQLVFFKYGEGDENLLTQKRMEFISNKFLRIVAIGNKLYEFMITDKSQLFIPGIQIQKQNID